MGWFTLKNGEFIYTMPWSREIAMPLFNQLTWRGIGATLALISVALAFAVVGYAEWSSQTAFDDFLTASTPSLSDQNQSADTPIPPNKGQPSCYRNKGAWPAASQ